MITKPTVLVMGAGASMGYNFPSGSALIYHVCTNTKLHRTLERCGVAADAIQQFTVELKRSQQASIDAFLEHRPEFRDVGKLAIAAGVAVHEDESVLMEDWGGRTTGCYHYLFNKMNASLDAFGDNQLSVITFNYDRSFEHFLFQALANTYGKKHADLCAEKLQHIPIIHVHGSLGPLPWQDTEGKPYQTGLNSDVVMKAASQIKVMSETSEASVEYRNAIAVLKQAERAYFLGCGYHDANLRRLRLDEPPGTRPDGTAVKRSGTWVGLGGAEKTAITRKWHIDFSWEPKAWDCLEFLREVADLN